MQLDAHEKLAILEDALSSLENAADTLTGRGFESALDDIRDAIKSVASEIDDIKDDVAEEVREQNAEDERAWNYDRY